MTQPSESAVLCALAAYRSRISGANHAAISAMVPQIESAEPEDDFDDEEREEIRLAFVHQLVGIPPNENAEPPIERARDILEHWDALAPQLALDGVAVNPDSAWRAGKREEYKNAILQGLRGLDCPTGTWALPGDFEVVMDHVDSLEGPGWRKFRDESQNLIFWEGWGAPTIIFEKPDGVTGRVRSGQQIKEATNEIGEKYDVAAGWKCGEGGEADGYIMFSRPKGDDGQDWSWRYVASLGQFGIKVFENMVDLLGWYQVYSQPRKDDQEITANEVFSAMG